MASGVLAQIAVDYPDHVAVIEMHASSSNDPYYLLEARNRWMNFYPGPPFYYPTLYVDGTDAGWPYTLWRPFVENRMNQPSPMTVTMWGDYDQGTLDGTIYAQFRNDSPQPQAITGRVYFVITEDSLYFTGSNGDAWHNHVARDYLPDEVGEEITIAASDSTTLSRAFTIDATWVEDMCEIVTWIQNEGTRETYQGGKVNLLDLTSIEEDVSSELASRAVKPVPNPCVDGTQFTVSLPAGSVYEIDLYDISGRQVRSLRGAASQNTESIRWNLVDDTGIKVSRGVYFYRFVSDQIRTTGKIVVR